MRTYSLNLAHGFCSTLILLSLFSNSALAAPGKDLLNGKLAPCPDTPNCISTENGDLAPISIGKHNPKQAWLLLQKSITQLGGKIETVRPDYLWGLRT